MQTVHSLLGLAALVGLAWAMSEDRRTVDKRVLVGGLGLQIVLALILLKLPGSREVFLALNQAVGALEKATGAGTSFVFGYLGGSAVPFDVKYPGNNFILAFKALPLILVVSALSSLLFYWRVLPLVVRGFSYLLTRTMGIGGALGVGVAANIFVGMVEAPLLVKPYLARISRSEMFVLMTSGMATIAGTVLVLYGSILRDAVPGAVGHILTASLISAPAAILVARLMIPETGEGTQGEWTPPRVASGSMDAVTRGTGDGIKVFINVVGMLIVLVALVALANSALALLPQVAGAPLTLERMLGWVMAPVVFLMGVPWEEAMQAGQLMGQKTILNEFIAYLSLANLPEGVLSERTRVIMTYAMCGFANLGSLGILIGGFGAMAPERRDEVVAMGFRSIVAGTLATCMTGAVVGLIV